MQHKKFTYCIDGVSESTEKKCSLSLWKHKENRTMHMRLRRSDDRRQHNLQIVRIITNVACVIRFFFLVEWQVAEIHIANVTTTTTEGEKIKERKENTDTQQSNAETCERVRIECDVAVMTISSIYVEINSIMCTFFALFILKDMPFLFLSARLMGNCFILNCHAISIGKFDMRARAVPWTKYLQ